MNPIISLANLIDLALEVYLYIIFIAVILSWIRLTPSDPTTASVLRFFDRATEPVFSFFRRAFRLERYTSPIDLTPLFVIVAIYFFRLFVVQTMRNMNLIGNLLQAIFYTAYFLLNIYFWIVVVAVFLSVMACFWPYHPMSQMRVPLIDRLTEPVCAFFKRLFKSPLEMQFQNAAAPLDASPLVVLLAIYLAKRLLIVLAMLSV